MTREQIKEQFPEATDEQITAILNINGADITTAKKNNVDPKEIKRLHGDEAFIDATQNLLFTNSFRWIVSKDLEDKR